MKKRFSRSPLIGQFRQVQIDALDIEAQGIGRLPNPEDDSSGKVVFVKGALPGEEVRYEITQDKSRFQKGLVREILHAAVYRCQPRCSWYGNCGGCTMQHIDSRAQIAIKQRVLEDNLEHIGKVKPQTMMQPIHGPEWEYRYRARLSVVNRSIKKGTILVGFHEPQNRYVSDMTSCEVLPQMWSDLLVPLRNLVMSLSVRNRVPQIELALGEPSAPGAQAITAMVLRHLLPLSAADEHCLKEFAILHGLWIWTQAQGAESVQPFYPLSGELFYTLPEFLIRIPFVPTDFTQVNHAMNRVLVGRAIRLLDAPKNARVLDLFCGIGNFSLPLGRVVGEVLGIEGSRSLCLRARDNAVVNQLEKKVYFVEQNLFEVSPKDIASWGTAPYWIIDPPRDGAFAIVNALAQIAQSDPNDQKLPKRIVYISCNPATLARDAGVLVNEAGYQLSQVGIMNMFAHTSHVESMALFIRFD